MKTARVGRGAVPAVENDHGRVVSTPMAQIIDQLTEATAYVRPDLEGGYPIGDRLRSLWAAVVAARDMGAGDVVENEFFRLAHKTGLAADLGHHADADLRHVIRWALLDMNPFQ